MKPMLETINVTSDASFKVETYRSADNCAMAGWHIHPEYELVFVKNGKGLLHIDSTKTSYNDGTLVFLAGDIPHADFGNRENADNVEIVIQFKQEFLDEKLKVFPELRAIKKLVEKSKHILIFDQCVKKRLEKKFKKFRNLDNQGKLINLLSILHNLSQETSYQRLRQSFPLESFKRDDILRLEQAFEYVNNQYSQNVSVEEISKQLGYTPNSFCRFFKKMTNKRFIGFVNEFRTQKAIELFNEANSSISDVMFRSGFNDASYFSKQFKKYQGTTPSEYVKARYSQSVF
ncbi:AraC family transcriptional regulator [Flagellimonas sp. S174]|uniref:AraC family transcriptional regulator n=1 Tax=Flagellimonas sp. S174 TaxID=3410790 RepID=UPI003BF57792